MYLHVVANIYESLSQLKNNWHKQMHGLPFPKKDLITLLDCFI